jgi:hypothetical protein
MTTEEWARGMTRPPSAGAGLGVEEADTKQLQQLLPGPQTAVFGC